MVGLNAYINNETRIFRGYYLQEEEGLANSAYDAPLHLILSGNTRKSSYDFNPDLDHPVLPINLIKWR